MSDEDELKARYWTEPNRPAMDALKATVAAQAARDDALRVFVEAERRLYDAQQQLQAARSFNRALN